MKNIKKIHKNNQKTLKKRDFLHKFNDFEVISPKTTFIECGAKIGENVTIYPNCYIDKNCIIGDNTVILGNCFLQNCICGEACQIGPFVHTREKTELGDRVRLGNFCETKNALIGNGVKIAHLSYIGDAEIGDNCNIGCGVIFANYDGINKYKTTIGAGCFVGCNVNLVAPLSVGKNCFIGAGSTITENLDDNSFAISRAELKVKPNNRG